MTANADAEDVLSDKKRKAKKAKKESL